MIDYDPASIEVIPVDPIGTALTWAACGCIWAIHLATYPLARSKDASRSKSNRGEVNDYHGGLL